MRNLNVILRQQGKYRRRRTGGEVVELVQRERAEEDGEEQRGEESRVGEGGEDECLLY